MSIDNPLVRRILTEYGDIEVEWYNMLTNVAGLWHKGYDLHFTARMHGGSADRTDEASIMGVLRHMYERIGPVQPDPKPAGEFYLNISDEVRALVMAAPPD